MKSKKIIPRFIKELCYACTSCVQACPTGTIDLQITNSIHGFRRYPFLIFEKKCISCSACEKECPAGAIAMTAANI